MVATTALTPSTNKQLGMCLVSEPSMASSTKHSSMPPELPAQFRGEIYTLCLQEAIGFATTKESRQLFTRHFLHGAPAARGLWETFQDDLAAEIASNLTQSAAVDAALKSIRLMLHENEESTDKYGLPEVHHENTEYDRLLGAFGRHEIQELADRLISQLTQEQKIVFDAITSSVIQQKGGAYMIDAAAGTGKTESTIAASLRTRGTVVLCTASTNMAALILPGGLTAPSTFQLLFDPAACSW